jgi:hypothetical protein
MTAKPEHSAPDQTDARSVSIDIDLKRLEEQQKRRRRMVIEIVLLTANRSIRVPDLAPA